MTDEKQLPTRSQPAATGEMGIVELVAKIARNELTAQVVVGEALDRIEVSQPTLNAFRVVRREQAMMEAADADRRLAVSTAQTSSPAR
jgi:amidase